ncbi:hypothetical protein [Gracilibacillus oryzae]|uniref:hypothetical protein n=1 Tax=Gracilibacillus oryzae TaxID=1672701 RepID=UPI001294EDB9|nr:hypothetical protein [Gracilibacillus oryzae]
MLINLEKYKIKKQSKQDLIKIPVYSRIYIEDNKLIGEIAGSGMTQVIDDYSEEG